MCLALYIAAKGEPPLVSWDEGNPGFNVVDPEEHERVVAMHFSMPNLRYLGAHTGCSCGFKYGGPPATTPDEEEQERMGRASVAALQSYLRQMVGTAGTVELYACWEGDWAKDCESRLEVTPDHFGGETFEVRERELLVVHATSSP